MTPSARIQSSIELFDQILDSWQTEKRFPADKLIERYFKSRRYIGSKDRGFIAELVYWALRHKAEIEWYLENGNQICEGRSFVIVTLILKDNKTLKDIVTLCDGEKYSPAKLNGKEQDFIENLIQIKRPTEPDIPKNIRLNYPIWLEDKLVERFAENLEAAMLTMNEQAPTDLRVNTLKISRDELLTKLQKEGFDCEATPISPLGIRLKKRMPIFTSEYFKKGCFEVQDEGSQILALLTEAKPAMKVIDFCAGAGGKTLAIAAMMNNKGRILAWDKSEKRLDQIKPRLKRAGVDNVQTHVISSEHDSFIKRHKSSADRVLVDAPCSGSGTWRRNPDLKWRFNENDLNEVTAIQQSILQSSARLTKEGGRLIYATCSLFRDENENQIENFLNNNNSFRLLPASEALKDNIAVNQLCDTPYFIVSPYRNNTDGFFAAILERV
ncbi:MAG: RsmB/NOP family class I SAM-dependent RNA methyltransferase [Rickettsiales bacterium]